MDPSFQLSLSGCIQEQNPVMQNPLSISCLRAIDYAVLIFFTVFMLSGLVLFVFRIINKRVKHTLDFCCFVAHHLNLIIRLDWCRS